MGNIKEHFENEAKKFDELIVKLIPYYDEMLNALINSVNFEKRKNVKILDLGCGTGNVSLKILNGFPKAEILCVDLSQNMIDIAKNKLSKYKNISFAVGNIADFEFKNTYDVILSSLAVHHLKTDEDKAKFYKMIFGILNKNGIFANADEILGENKYLQNVNMKLWTEYMKKNFSEREVSEKWLKAYESEDRPSKLIKQLEWMKNAGFKDVDIIWKYYNFAVFSGIKE
ncbi:MAG: methyltransferase domain-containing protein [Endomicrobiaceae bacterium]